MNGDSANRHLILALEWVTVSSAFEMVYLDTHSATGIKMCNVQSGVYTAHILSLVFLLINLVPHVSGHGEHRPVRQTKQGRIQGYIHTLPDGQEVERYLGVPFAKPPLGEGRFRLPVPPLPWPGIKKTLKISPACMQQDNDLEYILEHFPAYNGGTSEDCLYLNLYIPRRTGRVSNNGSYPVLIHVHGGSNEFGMGPMFHGDVLASLGGFIVVTFNYRLTAFGFLTIPHLGIPGNFGLYDQALAFRWVQENIGSFGGDPSKVTVQGHSAGSVDVGLHLLSPVSKGLFRNVILQSGSPTAYWGINRVTLSNTEGLDSSYEHNLASLGCYFKKSSEKTLRCLQSLNASTIAKENYEHGIGMYRFAPVVDQTFLLDDPDKLLIQMVQTGISEINAKSIMIGLVKDEGSLTADIMIKVDQDMLKTPKNETNDEQGYVDPPQKFNFELFKIISSPPSPFYQTVENMRELSYFAYMRWDDPTNSTAGLIGLSDMTGDITFVIPTLELTNHLANFIRDHQFLYRFEHRSRLSIYPEWMGVPHGEDLFYVFGSPIEGHSQRNYTELDKRVSKSMIQLWSSFVHSGQLKNPEGSPKLKTYGKDQNFIRIMSNGTDPVYKNDKYLRARFLAFWNYLVPQFAKPKKIPALNTLTQTLIGPSNVNRYEIARWVLIGLSVLLLIICLVLVVCLIHHKRKSRNIILQQASKEHAGNAQ